MIYLNWLSVKLFGNPCLFFLKVWLVLFVALESLSFGPILLLESCKKSTKSDQGCPRGGQNWSKGVPPRGSEKQVANKSITGVKNYSFWNQPGSESRPRKNVWRQILFKIMKKLQKLVYRKWHEIFMKMSYEMEGLGRWKKSSRSILVKKYEVAWVSKVREKTMPKRRSKWMIIRALGYFWPHFWREGPIATTFGSMSKYSEQKVAAMTPRDQSAPAEP